jgi:hypothetical protein
MNGTKRRPVYLAIAVCTGAALLVTDPSLSWTASDTTVGKYGYYTNSSVHSVPRPCGNWRSDPINAEGFRAEVAARWQDAVAA